jgi:hypothetical protein
VIGYGLVGGRVLDLTAPGARGAEGRPVIRKFPVVACDVCKRLAWEYALDCTAGEARRLLRLLGWSSRGRRDYCAGCKRLRGGWFDEGGQGVDEPEDGAELTRAQLKELRAQVAWLHAQSERTAAAMNRATELLRIVMRPLAVKRLLRKWLPPGKPVRLATSKAKRPARRRAKPKGR